MKRMMLLVAAIAAMIAPAAGSIADQSPTTTTTTATTTVPAPPVPKVLRNGCKKYHSRAFVKKYARMIYSGSKRPNFHRRERLSLLIRCQHTARAEHWAKQLRHKLASKNRFRRHSLCGSPACNRTLGMWMAVRRYGPGADSCIDYIVSNESHWDTTIHFGGGHGYIRGLAYGIPQALDGSKMASAGRKWLNDARTQIRWMLGYVMRYGGMCQAAAHWRAARSY